MFLHVNRFLCCHIVHVQLQVMYCSLLAVLVVQRYHLYLWLLYCKTSLSLSSIQPVMIQNVRPLTLLPFFFFFFYWLLSSNTVDPVSWIWSEAPDLRPRLCHGVNPSGGPGGFLSCWTGTLHVSAPCVNCPAPWCSSNLSGRYSPTLRPPHSSVCSYLSFLLPLCTL